MIFKAGPARREGGEAHTQLNPAAKSSKKHKEQQHQQVNERYIRYQAGSNLSYWFEVDATIYLSWLLDDFSKT